MSRDKTTTIALQGLNHLSVEDAYAEYNHLTTEEKALVWAKGTVQTYQGAEKGSNGYHVGQALVRMLQDVWGLTPVYGDKRRVVDFEPISYLDALRSRGVRVIGPLTEEASKGLHPAAR